jgi:uncharacterized membrane protein YesL
MTRTTYGSELIDKITSFILVNLFWALLSSLIIPLPMATAGLFATLTPWVRGEPSEPYKDFFGGMRQHWRKSTLIALIDVGIAGLILVNLTILNHMPIATLPALMARNVAFFVGLLTVLVNLYLWPLLVTVDLPVSRLIRIAARLVFLHPAWSLFAGTLMLTPLLLSLILPQFIALILTFSSTALLASWGAWHVIEQHKQELL